MWELVLLWTFFLIFTIWLTIDSRPIEKWTLRGYVFAGMLLNCIEAPKIVKYTILFVLLTVMAVVQGYDKRKNSKEDMSNGKGEQ